MNKYQTELYKNGYVRVDGIIAFVYGKEEYSFLIPKPNDYPGKKYIAGNDFIFIFEALSNQTWFKKIDLTQGAYRSSLFYIGYELTGEDDNESKYGVNVWKTAFSCWFNFTFDSEQFGARKFSYLYDPELAEETYHSPESVLISLSGDRASLMDQFLLYLIKSDDGDLIPFPNKDFHESFGFILDTKKPVLFDGTRHMYMLIVLKSWRDGKFPQNLTMADFFEMVTISQSPLRNR